MSNCRKEIFKINPIILKTGDNDKAEPTKDVCAPQSQVVNVIPKQADNDQELIKTLAPWQEYAYTEILQV